LNYNIKEIEVHIIGLIQKINENSAEINLFDLGNIVDISIEDFLNDIFSKLIQTKRINVVVTFLTGDYLACPSQTFILSYKAVP
jgi:hypothetical protein